MKRKWIDSNPAYGFEISDAGGTERSRDRWLNREELAALAQAMRETPNFGRLNELALWLLLALCVRKMELLSAQWAEFDLDKGVWLLRAWSDFPTLRDEAPQRAPWPGCDACPAW